MNKIYHILKYANPYIYPCEATNLNLLLENEKQKKTFKINYYVVNKTTKSSE